MSLTVIHRSVFKLAYSRIINVDNKGINDLVILKVDKETQWKYDAYVFKKADSYQKAEQKH